MEHEAALRWIENGQVFLVVADRAFIVPTQAVVDAEFLVDLPGILREEREGFDVDEAHRIADGDAGAADVAGEEVGEREHVAVGGRIGGPRTLRAVEQDVA